MAAKSDRNDDSLAPRNDPARLRDEDEIDRLAREGGKSEWMSSTDAAAGDPVSEDERRGLNVLGQNDPRGNGAINGVSDAGEGDVPRTPPATAPGEGERRNPPQID